MYRTFFCIFKMYNTGWAKSRCALDCFFTFMAEITGGYRQILDRSGKKIILLSALLIVLIFITYFSLKIFSLECVQCTVNSLGGDPCNLG